MAKMVTIDMNVKRAKLDQALSELPKKRKKVDVKKYFGKIDFGMDGLDYQLKARDEWR